MLENGKFEKKKTEEAYISFDDLPIIHNDLNQVREKIKETFTKAVIERSYANRPMGALLSGGLDSSLTSAILAREFKKRG